ncbi:MAG: hypothetical protein COB22_08350 [Cycloclasticus sp.]|nr:MAG: hypothetical protein COB22_08350 [Cycloclasticus sp.]
MLASAALSSKTGALNILKSHDVLHISKSAQQSISASIALLFIIMSIEDEASFTQTTASAKRLLIGANISMQTIKPIRYRFLRMAEFFK